MLMGNINIVRLSSKGGIQINLLLKLLNNLLKKSKYKDIASRQLLITYERDSKVTSYLSAHCDTRVIWGGDDTVNTIRKFPIPPAATDLVFPDKFSISLIGVSKFENLDENSKIKLVKSFINDAFWFGQMACSSPRLILWLGNSELIEETKKDFWARVDDLLDVDFAKISTADIVNKLVTSHSLAINSNINIIKTKNNLVNRINLYSLEKMDTNLHCGGGLFYEFSIEQWGDMIPFVSRKIQTIGYFGVMEEEIKQFITEHTPKGIDRFVPIGEALDFSPIWDGYNFLYEFTRTVDVKS